jgi:hypothetical protein
MALIPLNVDYTDKDFDSLRARLFKLIASVFPTWTDTSVANFGNLLVEHFAFIGDVLCFYQDQQARESRIVTAQLRKSLLGLAKLVGYTPAGASAATVDVTITLGAPVPASSTVTMPRGDRVKTAEITAPIFYQLLADVVFQAGEVTKSVSVENSVFQETNLVSSGVANQSFVLPATPYVDDSAVPIFANGTYALVDNFLASTSSDRHFTAVVDQNDRATLRFGNGVSGAIPQGSGSVEYKTGGGKAGRVEAGALKQVEKSYSTSLGARVTMTVTNPAASSGGEDRETNAEITINAPQSLRVLKRAVAREDYEIAALQVPGVARALLVTKDEYSPIPENSGYLFIVPVGGGSPSGALLTAVANQFIPSGPYPKTNTFNLQVLAATYLTVNVSAIIYMRQGFTPQAVATTAVAALQAHFAPQNEDGTANENINFGYYFQDQNGDPSGALDWSTMFDVVRDVSGLRKIDPGAIGFLLNGARNDLALTAIQFPVLGDISFRDGSTGLLITL